MSTADVPMFDVEMPEVRVPSRKKGNGRPRWSRYRVKTPTKCDDCMLILALAHGDAPPSNFARYRRVQDGADLLLCHPHARVRREEDGLEPFKETS